MLFGEFAGGRNFALTSFFLINHRTAFKVKGAGNRRLKQKKKNFYYQVFIEPKGEQFKDISGGFAESKEGWKEKFLDDISKKYGGKNILKIESKEYKLIGLPLYNEKKKNEFRTRYNSILEIE